MKFRPRYVIPVIVLIAGFVLMRFLFSFGVEAEKRKPAPRIKYAESVVVELGEVKSEIMGYGRLTSSQAISLISEVAGNIERGDVEFKPGTKFRAGDLLAKIDDRQIKLDVNSAKSDFLNALATVLPEIKIDFPEEFERWQNYFEECGFDKPLTELPEPANNKIKLFLSRFNVYKLYFNVKNLEIRLEKHYFYAPFNGSITSADLRIGSTARAGSKLADIVNLDEMELEIPLPAKDLKWIDKTSPIRISSNEIDGQWTGKIVRTGETINQQTQTLQAYIKINGSTVNLYNGVFLQVKIPGKIISDAIKVSRKAIYEESNVYLIENKLLKYVPVNVARFENNSAIINGGLADGDTLVVDVLQGVAQGMAAKAIISGEGE